MKAAIQRREWLWVIAVIQLIFLCSSLPYLAGYAAQTSEQHFAGGFHSRGDFAVYISMIHYGEQGHWDYQLRFTSEPHQPVYIFLFYVVLGNLTGWLGLSTLIAFHLTRWLFGSLTCILLYIITSRLFREVNWRRYAFLLATFGSGAGWIQAFLIPGARPVDFLFADGYVFFSIVTFPHYTAVIAALLFTINAFLSFLNSPRGHHISAIILAGIFAQFTNPIAMALADLALGGALIFHLWQTRRFPSRALTGLALIGLSQLPQLIYNARVLTIDPVWSRFTAQNAIPSPPLSGYLWGFGLFWLLVPGGFLAAIRCREPLAGGLLVWLIGALLLAYGPFPIQMRFLQVFIIPLALLGTFGLKEIVFPWLAKHAAHWLAIRTRLITFGLLLLVAVTSTKISIGDALYLYTHPNSIFFEPATLTAAADWLGTQAKPDDIVLATERSSQWIAIRSGQLVYLGHLFATLDYQQKGIMVTQFYQNNQSANWLSQANVQWIVYGPHEKAISPAFIPPPSAILRYDKDGVQIWQVGPHELQ